MDLGLDTIRTTGRAERPVLAEIVRELVQADIALLATEKGVKAPTIKALRDSHHSVARCVAEGKANTDIQLITGYSASRISILKGDPAFQELVAFYKEQVEEIRGQAFIDVQAKLTAVGSDALDEITDRLNEAPGAIATDELIDIVKLAADRTGHGPASKSTNVNVNLDLAARVSAGRQRVARTLLSSSVPPTVPAEHAPIEGEVVERIPPPPLLVGAK